MTPTEQRIHVFLSRRPEGATEEILKNELGVSHGSLYNAMTHGVIYRDGIAWKAVITKGEEEEKPKEKRILPSKIPLVEGEYDSVDRWVDDMQDVARGMSLAFQFGLTGANSVTVVNESTGEERPFTYRTVDGLCYVSQA